MKITIANKNNMFSWFSQKIFAAHFVQGIAQDRSKILPYWCQMKKLPANYFSPGGGILKKSCAKIAQDGFKTQIVLPGMLDDKKGECPVADREHFIRHPPKIYFMADEMSGADFSQGEIRSPKLLQSESALFSRGVHLSEPAEIPQSILFQNETFAGLPSGRVSI